MEQYLQWKELIRAGKDLPFWQEFYVKFYQAFIEADRWKQYLEGVGSTLMVTALALIIGVILVTTIYSGIEYFAQNWNCLWD